MCGRTALTASPEDLREALGLDDLPSVEPHYNVPPSRNVAVVRRDASGRTRLESMRWGMIPAWTRAPKSAAARPLARAETVAHSAAFREALRQRRCLVVVDGFYEWRREPSGASTPFFVRRPDRAPLTLAALWERRVSPDGEVLESCAIITQPSQPPVDVVHERMPLVIEPEARDAWLDVGRADPDALAAWLRGGATALVAYPVSPRVNDPRHDDPSCVEPAEPAQLALL